MWGQWLKALALLPFFFVSMNSAHAKAWRCDFSVKYACDEAECKLVKPTIWNLIDFGKTTISRCDGQGCDHYPMIVDPKGVFVNIIVPGKSMSAKMSLNASEYFEVVSLGMTVFLGFGSCKPN